MKLDDTVPSDFSRFLRRAWPPEASEFGAKQHQVLWHSVLNALQEPSLDALRNFIDPEVVGESISIGQENGFHCGRRLRAGEWAKLVEKRRWRAFNSGFDDNGNLLPAVSVASRDRFVRQRARAALELKMPLPEDRDVPGPPWPVGARFWFKLDMNDHENCAPYLNPDVTELFYDSPTFDRFVTQVLDEIDKELLALKPQTSKIRDDLRWWVTHDAKHVPGIDDT